jgi:hypothetical protein
MAAQAACHRPNEPKEAPIMHHPHRPHVSALALFAALGLVACSSEVTSVGAQTTGGSTTTGSSTASQGGAGQGGAAQGGHGQGGAAQGGHGQGGNPNLGLVDKVDILFAIDNSRSMADKQAILARAIPDLVNRLVNPYCIDVNGQPVADQPAGPLDPCPNLTTREFAPVVDIHLGVVTSSIGGHGSDACPDVQDIGNGQTNTTNNDHGELVTRTDPLGNGTVTTYQNMGFLAWDPAQKMNPPGEKDVSSLVGSVKSIVEGVGQIGCGYESQLEGWYRFLVDPAPYESISVVNGAATPTGVDEKVLQQRAAFLRPDSLLAVVMLTDENDCSTKEFGQFYLANQLQNPDGTPFHLPRARSECAKDINDPCCKSCGQAAGNCPADPNCNITGPEDLANLRCWEQKRRFGIDFSYPVDRYVQALTSAQIADAKGNLFANPIFTDLSGKGGAVRDPGLVFFQGIVGVPWQDLARDPKDLGKGFKSAAELATPVAKAASVWDLVVGDPDKGVKPLDPLMQEANAPRSGSNPITGDALGTSPGSNPINGNEVQTAHGDDLEFACVFDLLPGTERDCSVANGQACDCAPPAVPDNPLCAANPNDGGNPTIQKRAKAYPSLRELAVLKGIGSAAVVSSICPAQVLDATARDYAYRPAMRALVEAAQVRLKKAQ